MLKCNYILQANDDDDKVMLALIERSLEPQHQNLNEIDEWLVAVGVCSNFAGSGSDVIEN